MSSAVPPSLGSSLDYALRRGRYLLWYADFIPGLWKTTVLNEEAAHTWLSIPRQEGHSYAEDLFWARSAEAQREGCRIIDEALAANLSSVTREFELIQTDGSVLWVQESIELEQQTPGYGRAVGVWVDITERKSTERQLIHEAHHDPLTQLPNRAYLSKILEKDPRSAQRLLLFLDLDNFKAINDNLGHPMGDQVLVEVAKRLRQSVGARGDVIRLGGDEFTVLLRPDATHDEAWALAERVQEQIRLPLSLPLELTERIYLSASIGISLGSDQGATGLLRNADIAMYAAKTRGRGRACVFDAQMEQETRLRFELENALRVAIEREQLTLAYQPLFLLESRAVVGLEALARWQHPTHGNIPPDQFIPIAEETGLIVPLGFQLLRQACHCAVRWRQLAPHLSMGVNISVAQLQAPHFTREVLATLEQTGLPPDKLVLEVTESIFALGRESVLPQLQELYDAGVALVLDDFGIGYSSLSALSELPIHALKIDRSFLWSATDALPVRAQRNQALLRAMVSAGQALDLLIVAEGIETAAQRELARSMRCALGQGYHFQRPLAEHDVAAFLSTTTHASATEALRTALRWAA
ncbi:putative bifunctional diguanylate cyclase/phosphodiesterase [Armatimonas rosea]|uniref:Diguanylate cyclase (GGDEF)-like protein n=1 Tax=Armatimonas rosea TaxID=685828 RepID=A0A7W9W480_ARMRO|nr:bifunctional diguanylate cyclase/phosphodiesterase [Armatimonas rosea]MBB6048258.1 diguanylate cyclase (GGDEF)-like protein [Armatimonas rosea]